MDWGKGITVHCDANVSAIERNIGKSYFSKFSFLFHLKNHHSKDVNFKFQLKQLSGLGVRCNFVYCCLYLICVSLIMVTIIRHIFINIFQTENFLAVKFSMGYEKSMSFLVIAKSPKVWKKKVKDRTRLLYSFIQKPRKMGHVLIKGILTDFM